MKKIFVIALGFIVMKTTSAQVGTTHFGIKAGVNITDIKVQNTDNGDSRIGFHVGGLAHIHLSRQFALQPELVFSTQGREESVGGVEYKTNLSYINVPVLGQYMFGNGFRLQTGPQVGFLLDAENSVNGNEQDAGNAYKSIDFSWAFGASYLTSLGLGIDARYNLGLSNINDLSNTEYKNRVWQIGLFYQFQGHRHKK